MSTAIVHMLGAGLNRAVRNREGESPPLAHDFFQILLTMRKYAGLRTPIEERLSIVFDYVKRYWRLIVDPNRDVGARVRSLTHYRGDLVTYGDLTAYVAALPGRALATTP